VEEVGDDDMEVEQAVGLGFLGDGIGTGMGSGHVDDGKVKVRDGATGGCEEGF